MYTAVACRVELVIISINEPSVDSSTCCLLHINAMNVIIALLHIHFFCSFMLSKIATADALSPLDSAKPVLLRGYLCLILRSRCPWRHLIFFKSEVFRQLSGKIAASQRSTWKPS